MSAPRIKICKLGLGMSTDQGPYWAKVDGANVGEHGRSHWETEADAMACAERFIARTETLPEGTLMNVDFKSLNATDQKAVIDLAWRLADRSAAKLAASNPAAERTKADSQALNSIEQPHQSKIPTQPQGEGEQSP